MFKPCIKMKGSSGIAFLMTSQIETQPSFQKKARILIKSPRIYWTRFFLRHVETNRIAHHIFYHNVQIERFCLKLQWEPLEHRCFSFSSCAWHRGFPFEKLVFLRKKTPSLPTPISTRSHRFVSPQVTNRLGRIKTRFWSRMIMRWHTGLTSRLFGWSAAASTRA